MPAAYRGARPVNSRRGDGAAHRRPRRRRRHARSRPSCCTRYVLGLTGKERPRLLYVPTAAGDDGRRGRDVLRALRAPSRGVARCGRSRGRRRDLRELVLSQDAICVSGGNTANMLAIWRVHGIDAAAARGVGAGRRPLRRERRDDLLVRAGRHRLVRAAARGDGLPRLAARERVPALRRRGAPPAALPRARRRRPRRRASPPTTASASTTSARSSRRSSRAAPARRRTASPATVRRAASLLTTDACADGAPAGRAAVRRRPVRAWDRRPRHRRR